MILSNQNLNRKTDGVHDFMYFYTHTHVHAHKYIHRPQAPHKHVTHTKTPPATGFLGGGIGRILFPGLVDERRRVICVTSSSVRDEQDGSIHSSSHANWSGTPHPRSSLDVCISSPTERNMGPELALPALSQASSLPFLYARSGV